MMKLENSRYPRLEMAMHIQNITKKELAGAIGMKYHTFCTKQQNAGNDFTVQDAFKMAEYLGKTVEELFYNG